MASELYRYILAGVINTINGYIAFLVALHVLGLGASLSNGISYAVGLVSAYVMSLVFVFRESQHSSRAVIRFLTGFGVAYSINLAVLHVAISGVHLRPELAQIVAMGSYTISFYFINKCFVWRVQCS